MEATLEREYILTAHDRCDRCGAQAYFRAMLTDGTLDFCYHHYNIHKDALESAAFEILDESDRL